MKRNLIRAVIILALVLVIGALLFLIIGLLFPKSNLLDVPGMIAEIKDKPTMEQKAIISADFEGPDDLTEDNLSTREEVVSAIHMMANSKIIAGDGQIWGIKRITRSAIDKIRAAMKKQEIGDEELNAMLSRWEKQDYSQCVADHNYVWRNYLRGTVGEAVKLRPEAKAK